MYKNISKIYASIVEIANQKEEKREYIVSFFCFLNITGDIQRIQSNKSWNSEEKGNKDRSPNCSHLTEQMMTHTGKKPHECSQCGNSFKDTSSLKTHQRIHTGEKLHQCSQCGKAFSRINNFKTHQRIHTGEKPYQCSQCGKAFSQIGHLKSHQTTHTGEKPHQCSQ